MNEETKRIWITFEIPIFEVEILKIIAMKNETNLLTLISNIIYEKTRIEVNASDIRIKQKKNNILLNYISLEIPKNKALELTNKGLERNKSRQKLLVEICQTYLKENNLDFLNILKEAEKKE